jgi:hypothetical protein
LRIGFLVVTLEMMKKKPKKRSKCIKANSIVLTDSEGKTRIVLDAGEKDGYARIILFAKDGKSIQISSQPEGAIQIILFGKKFQSHAGISIGAKGEGSIFITNKEGKLGTVLGEEPETKTHRLILFKNGQHFWNTPSGKEGEGAHPKT